MSLLVAAGAATNLPAVHPLQPGAAHQAFHPAVADVQVLAQDELGVHSARAVGAVGGGVRVVDQVHQLCLLQVAVAGAAAVPGIEAGGGQLQHPAGRGDGDPVVGELADHREDHFVSL